ncbi:MAG: 1-acyl-sn-glycerol-3-phosphate acyltransferase [Paludibacter sp.]|jgi:1-acyl-sn-glycerol-3-phosphate acyltransferase|nr:1-acyl-sn-glycerol-3-phosphate acyltransferase [Paludibacter sp.]
MKIPFFLYQWLIAYPIFLTLTIVVAISTIIFSPIFPNNAISYAPARAWGKVFCLLFFIKVEKEGFENIDRKQSYIIAANHQSIIDVFAVYGWMPVIFKWVIKAELRNIPFVGWACDAAGHIFIDRKNPMAAKRSIEKAEKKLVNGVSVVIFPEGTRTRDGKMSKFKRGAFRIATDLQLPVLPVTLNGFYNRMSRSTFTVTPGRVKITIHQPIDVKQFTAKNTNELIEKTWQVINEGLRK